MLQPWRPLISASVIILPNGFANWGSSFAGFFEPFERSGIFWGKIRRNFLKEVSAPSRTFDGKEIGCKTAKAAGEGVCFSLMDGGSKPPPYVVPQAQITAKPCMASRGARMESRPCRVWHHRVCGVWNCGGSKPPPYGFRGTVEAERGGFASVICTALRCVIFAPRASDMRFRRVICRAPRGVRLCRRHKSRRWGQRRPRFRRACAARLRRSTSLRFAQNDTDDGFRGTDGWQSAKKPDLTGRSGFGK